jgi:hypothetical protein
MLHYVHPINHCRSIESGRLSALYSQQQSSIHASVSAPDTPIDSLSHFNYTPPCDPLHHLLLYKALPNALKLHHICILRRDQPLLQLSERVPVIRLFYHITSLLRSRPAWCTGFARRDVPCHLNTVEVSNDVLRHRLCVLFASLRIQDEDVLRLMSECTYPMLWRCSRPAAMGRRQCAIRQGTRRYSDEDTSVGTRKP